MNRITATALLAIANLAMAGTSFAQSSGVEAQIPFDFTVAGKLLPAGTYTIRPNSSHTIVIRNHNHPANVVLSLVDSASNPSSDGGRLLFHKYGSQYFLSEILCDSANMNMDIPPSKAEKVIQVQQAKLTARTNTLVATR